jgi:hypothetical protein
MGKQTAKSALFITCVTTLWATQIT